MHSYNLMCLPSYLRILILFIGMLPISRSAFAPQSKDELSTGVGACFGLPPQRAQYVVDPAARQAKYQGNTAQYLVDLHDAKAVFNFCGGMLFQLSLSDRLRTHLAAVAKGKGTQPFVYDASKLRMSSLPGYTKSPIADNVKLFQGREVRKVPHAKGGFGFMLQLSMATSYAKGRVAGENDPQGWTKAEVASYDGWGHDVHREWRRSDHLEHEGFTTFSAKFHKGAVALHHRFYLHLDASDRLWLAAEDGCEGVVAETPPTAKL